MNNKVLTVGNGLSGSLRKAILFAHIHARLAFSAPVVVFRHSLKQNAPESITGIKRIKSN